MLRLATIVIVGYLIKGCFAIIKGGKFQRLIMNAATCQKFNLLKCFARLINFNNSVAMKWNGKSYL